ncbi:uncharacterized protein K460DRAFT_280828 [Cucurbitaria berberidis CBS 394.84]|uniref:Zn(2)-C6 fungal-type domain-containing protein n=1 Tax=Cucurbitaria berberidis CBS 394.84 TaxID=1168544 RepID=A0A9P4GMA8_9PLEO|nr:uncharacterized protein K460DRAFT_280828 [Cucurbitaria berberidis CBS 394.84]KAF1849018.1 hypothetical protein K460DRAFT_280828 [Cucurbitaria berberidis CBS 394.84]
MEPSKQTATAVSIPYRRRTTTGCLTCRMRRKKCNEEKPNCVGCRQNKLICNWPSNDKTAKEVSLSRIRGQVGSTARNAAVDRPILRATTPHTVLPEVIIACDQNSVPHPLGFMPGIRRASDWHLFDHYVGVTAVQLAGRLAPRNAFLSHLLPVAYQDARVVQCILALSGAQLCFRSNQFEYNARSHYMASLRSVKHALLTWRSLTTTELVGLLTTTLLLCYFEILICNTEGHFFYHLRASRVLLIELRDCRADQVDQSLLDLLTEFYAYFAISTTITLHTDLPVNRHIPEDSFLSSAALSSLNRGNDIYGVLFGSAHGLWGLIMPIARSARYFGQHQNVNQRDINLRKYESEILSWTYTPFGQPSTGQDTALDPYQLAGEIYQQTLLIFLYTTFNGPNPPTPDIYAKVDACVATALRLVAKIPLTHPLQTTLTWPSLIVGSCMRNPYDRAGIKYLMKQQLCATMLDLKRNLKFLLQLWEYQDKDETVYGPYGIELVIKRKSLHLCIA